MRGDSLKQSAEGIRRWRDKRDVCFISSCGGSKDILKPASKFTPDEFITVPELVLNYNANMGCVDHMDQLRSYYNVGRTGKKWWKYLFWGMLNITLVNAYIVLLTVQRPLPKSRRHFSLKSYKMKLVHELCDGYSGRKSRAKGQSATAVERVVTPNLKAGHSLVKFDGRKKGCVVCIRNGRRAQSGRCVETSFGCSTCCVSLCRTGSCFHEFHGMF